MSAAAILLFFTSDSFVYVLPPNSICSCPVSFVQLYAIFLLVDFRQVPQHWVFETKFSDTVRTLSSAFFGRSGGKMVVGEHDRLCILKVHSKDYLWLFMIYSKWYTVVSVTRETAQILYNVNQAWLRCLLIESLLIEISFGEHLKSISYLVNTSASN